MEQLANWLWWLVDGKARTQGRGGRGYGGFQEKGKKEIVGERVIHLARFCRFLLICNKGSNGIYMYCQKLFF